MSLRPIDLNINFLREGDARTQRVKEGLHEEGAQRYAVDLERERQLRDEGVRDISKSGFDGIREEERRRREAEEKKKRGGKPAPGAGGAGDPSDRQPPGSTAEPTKGSIIDIRFS